MTTKPHLRTKHGKPREVSVDELATLDAGGEELAWVDFRDPEPETIQALGRSLTLHPLALEDALKQRQRPKLDVYRGNGHDYDFVTFYGLRFDVPGRQIVEQELSFFIGPSLLVTLHRGPMEEVEEAAARWAALEGPQGPGPGFLLYTLLDTFVDSYFPVIDSIAEEIDGLEEAIFRGVDTRLLRQVFVLRRALLDARRILTAERDVVGGLTRGDQAFVTPALNFYFMDVYDHLIRVSEAIDMQRDLLSNLLEGYLSMVSNDLNRVMKRLTALATILIVLGLITGVYGMNFAEMPGLDSPAGFWVLMGLMAIVAAGLGLFFKAKDWI